MATTTILRTTTTLTKKIKCESHLYKVVQKITEDGGVQISAINRMMSIHELDGWVGKPCLAQVEKSLPGERHYVLVQVEKKHGSRGRGQEERVGLPRALNNYVASYYSPLFTSNRPPIGLSPF